MTHRNHRILLSLALVAGCSDPSGASESDGATSQSNGTSGASSGSADADSGVLPTGSTTDMLPTSGGLSASQGSEESGGGQGASQSGTSNTQDTGNSGSSDTGEPGTTSSTTTGETTIGETTTGETTTGERPPGELPETPNSETTTGEPPPGELPETPADGCIPQLGPAPVMLGLEDDLGSPAPYVVLAKAGITNVPGTAIVGGHIAVSPIAATSMTGFGLTLHPSGVYSTSPAVMAPSKVYAADYAVPTPGLLTTAVLGMQGAYTDAAGRVPTDYLDLESGDIGGLTLAPGIYTWGSTVLIPDDVTLEGCEDDVWIFQIAGDLDVSTGKKVLLAGGAAAKNVFWQIAGQATVHVAAHLEGVMLVKTGITFQTAASLHGRAYAQTMVAFDMNAITAP